MTDDWDPRKSKALRESLDELHAIRAQIAREETNLTPEERVAKTAGKVRVIIDGCGLKVLPPDPDEDQEAERLIKALEK